MRRTREKGERGGEISSRNWRNKVKVRSLAFCQKAWSDSNFVWRKPTREALPLIYFSTRNRGKSFESSMLVLMISPEM